MTFSRVFLGHRPLQFPRPRQLKSVNIPLKKHDICLQLQVPNFGLSPERPKVGGLDSTHPSTSTNVSAVRKAHLEFKVAMHPDTASSQTLEEQSRVEISVIEQCFPGYLADSVRTCFTAWLAFACAMDDILECLSPHDGEAVLSDCIEILRNRNVSFTEGRAPDTRVQRLTWALYDHSTRHLPPDVCHVFFGAICEVFNAHIAEFHFLGGQISNDLSTYMSIRRRTIALDPFFEVIKYLHLPETWRRKPVWKKLQKEVCSTAGLQNDLLGLEKDIENGDELNSVLVLLRNEGVGSSYDHDPALFAECISLVVKMHNDSAARAAGCMTEILQLCDDGLPESVVDVARHIMLVCETHLAWCASAKRYMPRLE